MAFGRYLVAQEIVSKTVILDDIITAWENKYASTLDSLPDRISIDSEAVVEDALTCRNMARFELATIRDIRSELEDCHMVKELASAIKSLQEERTDQERRIRCLLESNKQLRLDKQQLEKQLDEKQVSKLSHSSQDDSRQFDFDKRRSSLTAHIESLNNRLNAVKRMNKSPDYCHLAPTINLFSDSEVSVSEEDSLEKDKIDVNGFCDDITALLSPNKLDADFDIISKSTPIKQRTVKSPSVKDSNLTQDLKDIQKYLSRKEDESLVNHSFVIDWEFSNVVLENSGGNSVSQGKEDLDDDEPFLPTKCCENLKLNQDKLELLSKLISELYVIVTSNVTEKPTCSGDQNQKEFIKSDPFQQLLNIKAFLNDMNNVDKDCNENDLKSNTIKNFEICTMTCGVAQTDEDCLSIFKSLSEISIRLIANIIQKVIKINRIFSKDDSESYANDSKDYTLAITEYLQYLMSVESVDFNKEENSGHFIYDLIEDLRKNVEITSEQLKTGNSNSITEQIQTDGNNRAASFLKQQLEGSEVSSSSKLSSSCNVEALFEAKQKLESELEVVEREYSKQITKERKRLEESEILYNELLADFNKMQTDYEDKLFSVNSKVEQLERKVEADKRFIMQQQMEWELERSQHNLDISSLNDTLSKMKKSSTPNRLSMNENGDAVCQKNIKKSVNGAHRLKDFKYIENEIDVRNSSTQTISKDIIVFKQKFSLKDVLDREEFGELKKDLQEKQYLFTNLMQSLLDLVAQLLQKTSTEKNVEKLQGKMDKVLQELFCGDSSSVSDLIVELTTARDLLIQLIEDEMELRMKVDKTEEELEISATNISIRNDRIQSLEDEVQSLIDYQRNLTKDYDIVQSMLEDKQKELDNLSDSLMSREEELINTVKALKKEITEKQNVIDERDEDIYVLKEEKEHLENGLETKGKQCEDNITLHKGMLMELEVELQKSKSHCDILEGEIKKLSATLYSKCECIAEQESLVMLHKSEINDLKTLYEKASHESSNYSEKLNFAEIRLSELKKQHSEDVEKLSGNLKELEEINRKLIRDKMTCQSVSCQTTKSECNHFNDSLMNCVSIQERLSKAVDILKKKYKQERDERLILESRLREYTSQYQLLSSKVHSLETSALQPLSFTHTKKIHSDSSPDSSFLNDSRDIFDSCDEDIELNEIICVHTGAGLFMNGCHTSTQTDDMDKLFHLKENMSVIIDNNHYSTIADWLGDLLKEVETVLQYCIFNGELPTDLFSKMQKFKDIVEQFYKKQLASLVSKITISENAFHLERKTNHELKNKSDFLMTELQELESVQKSLRARLDQEISTNNRLSDANRNLNDQLRSLKSELGNKMDELNEQLEEEKVKLNEVNRQFKTEQQRRTQSESGLMVAEERLKLVEQSNTDLTKKNRQLTDYHQKEVDIFNEEYAEMFKKCNGYKLQLESSQQSLHYQTVECEKTKSELLETIKSNTEYRNKMNEFIKIYQERRNKLETEVNELHQLLQISCRREVTFIKENETLRMKYHGSKRKCSELEKSGKKLEDVIRELHDKHEEDRQEWLDTIGSSFQAKKSDEGIISQINWLLKMLQLRIELLLLHFKPDNGVHFDDGDWLKQLTFNTNLPSRPYSADSGINRRSTELLMLLQSIKSMQNMISVYQSTHRTSDTSNCGNLVSQHPLSNKCDKQSLINRPKPMGSSDSIESASETDACRTDGIDGEFDALVGRTDDRVYLLQTGKIIDLQRKLLRCDRWLDSLTMQKRYILQQLPRDCRLWIVTPHLTECQRLIKERNIGRFRLRVSVIATMVVLRLARKVRISSSELFISSAERTVDCNRRPFSQIPQPVFSTAVPTPTRNNLPSVPNERSKPSSKTPSVVIDRSNATIRLQQQQSPSSVSFVTMGSKLPGNARPLRSSFRSNNTNSNRQDTGRTASFSHTMRQIDDFGRRLDKYSERKDDE